MAEPKELNSELQAKVNQRFDTLLKEIGPGRQQLSTKVSKAFLEFHKELGKTKADSKRAGQIMGEITKIEKMAAQQLPHHLKPPVKPVAVAKPTTGESDARPKPIAAVKKETTKKAVKTPSAKKK